VHRRRFLGALAAGLAAVPRVARSQQGTKTYRIGYMSS
jgi:hypothetical protein